MVSLSLIRRVKAAARVYLALKSESKLEAALPEYSIEQIIQSPLIPAYRKREFQKLHELIHKAESDAKYSDDDFRNDVAGFRDSLALGWSGIALYSFTSLFSLGIHRAFGPYTDCYSLLFKVLDLSVAKDNQADKIYCLSALLTGLCRLEGKDTYEFHKEYTFESENRIEEYITLMFQHLIKDDVSAPMMDFKTLMEAEKIVFVSPCPFG